MERRKKHTTEVWAQLTLAEDDSSRIRDFLTRECGIPPNRIVHRMHLTVYHARRNMPGVVTTSEAARVVLAAHETRFMVMAPGGENPRPTLTPANLSVGIRIHKQSEALKQILSFRDRLLKHELPSVLGGRRPSTRRRSAFGARHFQPHMTLLLPGNAVDRDLRPLGAHFRTALGHLTFDRFIIDVVQRTTRKLAETR